MQFINSLKVGDRISSIYFCKSKNSCLTKAGKPFEALNMQDKTGIIDAKIWDPNSAGIDDFDAMDYVDVSGEITEFNGALQMNIQRARKVSIEDINPGDYMPTSERGVDEMLGELKGFINSVSNEDYKKILGYFFGDSSEYMPIFKKHSAAKTVHHSFIGGLLEHTVAVTKNCEFFCTNYPFLKKDLLLTAAMLHDIGKLREIEAFPVNDYSDEGNLIGHIVVGVEMIDDAVREIGSVNKTVLLELKHCIVSHHGELEYGSPKKPALAEAIALSFADNIDAKLETIKEALAPVSEDSLEWQKRNFFLDTIIRRTSK